MNLKTNYKLPPCPNKPNCVCSEDSNKEYSSTEHFVEPFKITGDSLKVWESLKKEIEQLPRTKIVEFSKNRLQAQVKSFIFGFIDDVEARLDIDANLIHIRSASRTGYSDMGVNRKRIEFLRTQLIKKGFIK